MAIKGMHVECDTCDKETSEFEDIEDAASEGWFFLTGPHPWDDDEGWMEKAYCSIECLRTDVN